MGNMITVMCLTDAIDQIKAHPNEFLNAVLDGGLDGHNAVTKHGRVSTYGVGNHCNCVHVEQYHHMDDPSFKLTWRNSLITLDRDTEMEYLKMAKMHIDFLIRQKKQLKNAQEVLDGRKRKEQK